MLLLTFLYVVAAIYIYLIIVAMFQEEMTLQFDGQKLDKKDFFGKSDPFLVISRSNEDGR